MKVKLQAGAELDLFNREEMAAELDRIFAAWKAEIPRGVKWRPFSASTVAAGGVWAIGGPGNDKDQLGPNPGFVWAVTRLAVSGNGVVQGTDIWNVFMDDIAPSKLVSSGHTRFVTYDVGVFVLNPNGQILAQGAATGLGGTDVTLSGQAVELPKELSWQLL